MRGGAKRSNPGAKQSPNTWTTSSAKAHFGDLLKRAQTEGPQFIVRGGRPGVVVLSSAEYERLTEGQQRNETLVEFFARSPLAGQALDLKRERDLGRDIQF